MAVSPGWTGSAGYPRPTKCSRREVGCSPSSRTTRERQAPDSILQLKQLLGGAVVGAPDRCVERLQGLAALGLDKLFLATNFNLMRTEAGRAAIALVAKEVLPVLRTP